MKERQRDRVTATLLQLLPRRTCVVRVWVCARGRARVCERGNPSGGTHLLADAREETEDRGGGRQEREVSPPAEEPQHQQVGRRIDLHKLGGGGAAARAHTQAPRAPTPHAPHRFGLERAASGYAN